MLEREVERGERREIEERGKKEKVPVDDSKPSFIHYVTKKVNRTKRAQRKRRQSKYGR